MDIAKYHEERQALQSAQMAADPAQFGKSFTEVPYASDSPEQVMDIFLPESEGVWPVVMFVHGGGWYFGGRREECISSVFKIVSQGYAVATIDYRLAPDATFPKQIQDVKSAIRFLKVHAAEYQLDVSRLVIWGNSAGGHLTALAACPHVPAEFEDFSTGSAEADSKVDGLLAWYGVYDFVTQAEQMKQLYPERDNTKDSATPALFGGDMSEANLRRGSAISYVTPDFPPVLLQQGQKDVLVPWLQTEEFYNEICRVCGPDRVQLDYFPEAGHGDARIKANDNILRCVRFLDSIYYPDSQCPYLRGPLPELTFIPSVCTKVDPYETSR